MARDTGKLLTRALDDAEAARALLRKARGDVRRYRGKAAKTRARNRASAAERKLDLAVARVDRYASVAAQEERATPVARGEAATEWEVGFSYEGTRRLGNAVMVNFRIMKRGGDPVTKAEAQEAVRVLHRGGGLQDVRRLGLQIEGVDWRRPNWRQEREGSPNDLMNFSAIMQTVFSKDFRLSPVKDDDL